MSDETALAVLNQAKDLVASANGMIQFPDNAEIVDWGEVAEAIDPRGISIPVRQLVGQGLTIQRLKPFESKLSGEIKTAFWAVCSLDSGQLVNTVLGSDAVIEELRNIMWLNLQLVEARKDGDVEAMRQYEAAGAGKRPRLVLEFHEGKGRYNGYYTVQRTVNQQNPLTVEANGE